MLLAWYPTPEYGGLYAAQSQGFFKKQSIKVNIMPGGPQVSPTESWAPAMRISDTSPTMRT